MRPCLGIEGWTSRLTDSRMSCRVRLRTRRPHLLGNAFPAEPKARAPWQLHPPARWLPTLDVGTTRIAIHVPARRRERSLDHSHTLRESVHTVR